MWQLIKYSLLAVT